MSHSHTLALIAVLAAGTATAAMPEFHMTRIPTPKIAGEIALPVSGVPQTAVERWDILTGPMVVKKGDRIARNVTQPTLTPVLPAPGRATGAAVVVAPGGAFMMLSMDHEGFAVARRLAEHGIAAFVLKYRLLVEPDDESAFMVETGKVMAAATSADQPPDIKDALATEDALAALKLVRSDAARWHVDPQRVGMIGFSAGAMTALQAALADEGGPAFVGYIYGPMVSIHVPPQAPPLFAAYALDDGLFGRQGFGIVEAWHAAGRPVELHAYERGDHGFGLGKAGTTSTLMPEEFVAWLTARGALKAATTAPLPSNPKAPTP